MTPAAGNYLCVKGRYGWDALHSEERLITPKIRIYGKLVDCSWEEALSIVATNLNVIKNKRGASSIGGLGSVRTTNEDSYVFQKFMRAVVGTNNVDMLARLKVPKGLNTAFFSGSLDQMAGYEVILVLDKNVGEMNPLTGIEIVRAVNRNRRTVILVNDGYNKFNKIATVVIRSAVEQAVKDLVAALTSTKGNDEILQAAEILKSSMSVAIIVPNQLTDNCLRMIRELSGLVKNVAYYPVVPRSNFQGSLDMGILPSHYPGYRIIDTDTSAVFSTAWNVRLPDAPGMNAVEMLNAASKGKLAALYVMGDDPIGSDPSLAKTLRKLDFLVVQDIFMSETAKAANVVLPAASSAEKSGTFTNLERRLQQLNTAEKPAIGSKLDWEIIQDVAKKMGMNLHFKSVQEIMNEIRSVVPLYADLLIGDCWAREKSPLVDTNFDLSLASDSIMKQEAVTAERLLFSSGMSITRSHELDTIRHYKSNV